MNKKNKRLWLDMCAGSELKDTQGETLSVEGADISDLKRVNDNHGKGFFNSLGMITESKKIFKAEDCENERHTYYWEKIKAPYIYAKGYLHNDEDHPNARAAAAILKNIHREDVPLKLKASVEGGVVARGIADPTRLASTKIHSIALTFTPANNATLVEPLDIDKSSTDWESDKILIKSVMHLAETNIPSFRHIERHASASTILENINKIQELAKTIGIDIRVSPMSTETMMKQAAVFKVHNNLKQINEMVKALSPSGLPVAPKPVGGSAIRAAADKARIGKDSRVDQYQQNIGKLKVDAATAPRPSAVTAQKEQSNPNAAVPIKDAAAAKQDNYLKIHANKAMANASHLDNIHSDLVGRGIDPAKASQVVDRIRSHMSIQKSQHYSDLKDRMLKALTAGYGGAGAPMDMTGGNVFQSEALKDDGRKSEKSMKYISCDSCGDEQIHMKHQVKCRKCGSNFSLNKLENIL